MKTRKMSTKRDNVDEVIKYPLKLLQSIAEEVVRVMDKQDLANWLVRSYKDFDQLINELDTWKAFFEEGDDKTGTDNLLAQKGNFRLIKGGKGN